MAGGQGAGWRALDENAANVLWSKIEEAAFKRDVVYFKFSAIERKRFEQIKNTVGKAKKLLTGTPKLLDEFSQCWPGGDTSATGVTNWFAVFNEARKRIQNRQDSAAESQEKAVGSTSSRVFINLMRAIYREQTGKEPKISRPKKISGQPWPEPKGSFVRFVQEAWKQCFRKAPPPSGEAIQLVLAGKEPEEEEPVSLEW